jgi:hypothetical protein
MENPGRLLAEELLRQSESEASATPMDALSAVAQKGDFTDDHCFRARDPSENAGYPPHVRSSGK